MVEDRVKNFNCKQKESLIKIIDELGEKAKSIIMWAILKMKIIHLI